MSRILLASLLGLGMTLLTSASRVHAADPAIGHMVFFQLKENTKENRAKLVAACEKYLKDHEGVIYFSAGARADEFDREVNAKDWDVALHLVFKDKKSHNKYQDHPLHIKFIEENKATWKSVKVYDSHLSAPSSGK